MEKGMKAQLKVDGGDGDLPSIPGISATVKSDNYRVDWSPTTIATVLLCVLVGAGAPLFISRMIK
jgi:hypothetical protein